MNIGVILSGGTGKRFGSEIPKQYHKIKKREVISYVIDAFKNSTSVDKLIVVAAEKYQKELKKKYDVITVEGGDTRNRTVDNAIRYIEKNFPEAKNVLFADSVRPLLTPKYIDRVFELLDNYDGVITVEKITDSLFMIGKGIVERENYRLIQTPEAFRMQLLKKFDKESSATALVKQFEGNNIFYCEELLNNHKITYQDDLKIAEALLEGKND